MRKVTIAATGLLLGLAGCGSSNQPAAGSTPSPAEEGFPTLPAGAPADFAICMQCHSPSPSQNRIGPSLFGVVGRKAGSVPGFDYSNALRKSGIVWTPERLDKWLSGPMDFVPGTRMSFGGFADPTKRQAVIAYLKALK